MAIQTVPATGQARLAQLLEAGGAAGATLASSGAAWIRGELARVAHRTPALAPSLYDRYPDADSLPHGVPRFEAVSAAEVAGTVRHPSTVDMNFVPIRELRTANWAFRARRIRAAMEALVHLPPVVLIKAGEDYFVVDGHHRVAAAKELGADVDAWVTELALPRT